jgi:hypothetical protein
MAAHEYRSDGVLQQHYLEGVDHGMGDCSLDGQTDSPGAEVGCNSQEAEVGPSGGGKGTDSNRCRLAYQ